MSSAIANETRSTDSANARKRFSVVLTAALLPFLFAVLLTGLFKSIGNYQIIDLVPAKTEFASIVFPTRAVAVGTAFTAKGSLHKLPAQTTAYLMVKRANLYWPKKDLGQNAGDWSQTINEIKKKNSQLSLVVLAVNAADHALIKKWYDTANKSGKYPGIDNFEAAQEIAVLEVKQQ